MELQADVVVVGLGGWGANALWRLAKRGVSVIGIEARSTAHDQGSSHGITRLFRVACREHPQLGPVGLHALGLWDELGAATRTEQLTTTGALMVGNYNSETIQGSLAAAEAAGIKTELLAHEELRTRFPQYGNLDPDDVGLLDPFGGLNYPERAVEAATRQAVELGARVLTGSPVRAINDDGGGVTIETDAGVIRAEHVIVSAGCWAPGLLPELSDVLQPRRMPMFWFRPAADPDSFALPQFPAFIRDLPGGAGIWGHGSGPGHAIKIGMWDDGTNFEDCDPDTIDRTVTRGRDWQQLSGLVAQAFPGLEPEPVAAKMCMVTDSLDGQFLLGRLDPSSRIIVASGDTGHGFKHAPAIGELAAQIALGETPFIDLDFLNPARFAADRPLVRPIGRQITKLKTTRCDRDISGRTFAVKPWSRGAVERWSRGAVEL